MFHLAPPLGEGSGVRICSPGCVRSFQLAMCLGLPRRTSKATTVVATIPPSVSVDQSCVIRPAFCTMSISGASESATMSAPKPLATFCACVVLAPNEVWKMADCPLWSVFQLSWKAEMSSPYVSYTVLYAASVTTGVLVAEQLAALPPAFAFPPQAAPTSDSPTNPATNPLLIPIPSL